MPKTIYPGACIGIIGGGQLGKMLAIAAAELGYRTHVYCPTSDSPAFYVASERTQAPYDDLQALRHFAGSCDVITLEFENIPVETLQALEAVCPVHPNPQALHISQNRLREKRFAASHGVPCTEFEAVYSADELAAAYRKLVTPCILKTCELGYDGKGQMRIDCEADWPALWSQFNREAIREAILEARVPFVAELSCIVARRSDGQSAPFPVGDNHHVDGILDRSRVPSKQTSAIQSQAIAYSTRLAEALDLVGLLAVEFFVTAEGQLLFNEMAPRPHNSGHWTQDACQSSQFEQCIRAICGLQLGSTEQTSSVEMRNLIGDAIHEVPELASQALTKLHIYGKQTVKPGRKMGHVNLLQR